MVPGIFGLGAYSFGIQRVIIDSFDCCGAYVCFEEVLKILFVIVFGFVVIEVDDR
jgi:hypothetical protein